MSAITLILQLGLTLVFIGIGIVGALWAIRNGQYDDMDGPAHRILMDDDDPRIPFNAQKTTAHPHSDNPHQALADADEK